MGFLVFFCPSWLLQLGLKALPRSTQQHLCALLVCPVISDKAEGCQVQQVKRTSAPFLGLWPQIVHSRLITKLTGKSSVSFLCWYVGEWLRSFSIFFMVWLEALCFFFPPQHTEVDCINVLVLKGFLEGSSTQTADLELGLLGEAGEIQELKEAEKYLRSPFGRLTNSP